MHSEFCIIDAIFKPLCVQEIGDCIPSDLADVEPLRPSPLSVPWLGHYQAFDYASSFGSSTIYSDVLASSEMPTTVPCIGNMPLALESIPYIK